MPIFAVQYTYSAATVTDRDTHRPEHRGWLSELLAADVLLSSGPFVDGSGALLLFRATDETALRELLSQDPFARHELIDAVRITEWQPVLGAFTKS